MRPDDILTADYKDLPISNPLKWVFAYHKFPHLKALLCYEPNELMEMRWFNAKTLKELVVLLEKHGLRHQLK